MLLLEITADKDHDFSRSNLEDTASLDHGAGKGSMTAVEVVSLLSFFVPILFSAGYENFPCS